MGTLELDLVNKLKRYVDSLLHVALGFLKLSFTIVLQNS